MKFDGGGATEDDDVSLPMSAQAFVELAMTSTGLGEKE